MRWLTSETVLQHEEPGFKIGQRFAQRRQFLLRAVNFQAREVCDLQRLFQQRTHVLQVRQRPGGIFISFTAVDLFAIEAETIVKTLGLLFGLAR